MSFDNALQQKGYVRSGAELHDDNPFFDGTSQPPIPSPRGQAPTLDKPSINKE